MAMIIHRFFRPAIFRRNIFPSPKISKNMSSNSLFANLSSPVREFVDSLANEDSHPGILGHSDAEKKEVVDWIAKTSDANYVSRSSLPTINTDLTPRTYLVGNSATVADFALYGALHPVVSSLSSADYYSTPALTRYFNHIQHEPAVRASSLAPTVVAFDLDNAPKQERKAEAPAKDKKKKDKKEETGDSVPVADASNAQPSKKQKEKGKAEGAEESSNSGPKKEKKEKGKKEAAAAGEASGKKADSSKTGGSSAGGAAADSGDPIPSMIDLRVGHIVDVKLHPDADGLYVEQIDLAEEEGPRTVISGLVKFIPIEQMRNRYVVAVCNLKPANMRGIKSHAMVLCATSKDGKDAGLELVEPPAGSKPGERVYFEGFEDKEPIPQLNPKKKIFETIQPGFTTLETHEAAWVDPVTKKAHRIRTKDGVLLAPTYVGASLS